MKITDKLAGGAPLFSFEFFPPKDDAGVEQLFQTIERLRGYAPGFVSVTYGAGGSTRRLTVELVKRIGSEAQIETMAHLTCAGASSVELAGVLDELAEAGVDNVLALRGDPPRGEAHFTRPEGGFAHASELIAFIRDRWSFCIAGACYPEKHPEAPDAETDLANLRVKADAGADFLITQLFFDARDYFEFVRRARAHGIERAVLPGIMPIENLAQIKRITAMCGARIPVELLARLEAVASEPAAVRAIGLEHAAAQCRELLAGGAPGVHFYTLNRSRATVEILDALRRSS
ncbi:MAG: methylenetetrahydrofolate reductase [NAD(P)H] [Sorangiineae bacterium]|nr:methylenetetrahydrofolate reductase [NAD(P)H] [Polyangiaceae bacterium]MEB2322154.1 methylenetetrahydrofolate reductase [NAD(P)H] [Sorangiineae bacterium]